MHNRMQKSVKKGLKSIWGNLHSVVKLKYTAKIIKNIDARTIQSKQANKQRKENHFKRNLELQLILSKYVFLNS